MLQYQYNIYKIKFNSILGSLALTVEAICRYYEIPEFTAFIGSFREACVSLLRFEKFQIKTVAVTPESLKIALVCSYQSM